VTAVYVLDASAVLAVIFGEARSEVVGPALQRSAMSAVNLSEVVTKLIDRGYTIADAQATVAALGLDIRPFDGDLALAAA
jgi:PIN domain nuclease of toxin-antitoxin system